MQLKCLKRNMRFLFFCFIFLFISVVSNCQNLIGYNAKEIKNFMLSKEKDMNPEYVSNTSFRYLKYSDAFDTKTVLFFLNTDSVCRSVRIICNKSIRNSKIKELDSLYVRSGDNTWIDKQKGKNYIVRLKDDDWSLLSNLHQALRPFFHATKALSGSSYPSIGFSYYIYIRLKNFLEDHSKKDNQVLKLLKSLLLKQLVHYFEDDDEQLQLLKVCM